MKPLIGIFADVDDDRMSGIKFPYVSAIENSGGVPVLIPYVEKDETMDALLSLCHGFLFSGGLDIDPIHYGEERKSTCGEVRKYRDDLELRAFKKVFASQKPILGICRGAQVINIALGGTLYQDIPTEIPSELSHRQTAPQFSPSHSVRVLADTPLGALTQKERMIANSFHHQAVKGLGEGLVPMAYADDGVVEAFYMPSHPYLRAYQWHPERLRATDADNQRIFEDFAAACRTSF